MKRIEKESLSDLIEDWLDEGYRHQNIDKGYIGGVAFKLSSNITRKQFLDRLKKHAIKRSEELVEDFDDCWRWEVEEQEVEEGQ